MLQIGTKVVCISDKWTDPEFKRENPPRKGAVYVIRGFWAGNSSLGLKLIGSKTVHIKTQEERGFDSKDFRELDELQQKNKQNQINLVGKPLEDSFNPS